MHWSVQIEDRQTHAGQKAQREKREEKWAFDAGRTGELSQEVVVIESVSDGEKHNQPSTPYNYHHLIQELMF